MLSMVPSWFSIAKFQSAQMDETQRIAKIIAKYVPADATVIARSPQSSYLAKRHYAALPYLDFNKLMEYKKKFSRSALIITKAEEKLRPELSEQLNKIIKDNIITNEYKIILEDDCTIVVFNQET